MAKAAGNLLFVMTALRCKEIHSVLTGITDELGWDDFVFTFTLSKDWVDPDAIFVQETSPGGRRFINQFKKLKVQFTWMQLSTMKSDLPQVITLDDFQEHDTDIQTVLIMKQLGWKKALVWPTYGYGGALGFLVLYSKKNDIPPKIEDETFNRLCPLVLKFNAWSRILIKKKSGDIALSPRETECMLMVAEGKKSKEIAYLLNISQRTVEFHIQNAMQKLGGSSRSQAASRLMIFTIPQLTNMTALTKARSKGK